MTLEAGLTNSKLTANLDAVHEEPNTGAIQEALQVLQTLPNNFQASRQDVLNLISKAGVPANPEFMTLFSGVDSVGKSGDRIEFTRNKPTEIPLNGDILNGSMGVKSLNFGNVSFAVDLKNTPQRIENIKGISLTLNAFGDQENVQVANAALTTNKNGDSVVVGAVDNPLSPVLKNVLDIANTIPVTVVLPKQGGVELPTASSVLQSAADSTGPSLPGLVMHSELGDAASIAKFAQSNPVWMQDTVEPILMQIGKGVQAYDQSKTDTPAAPAPSQAKTSSDSKAPQSPLFGDSASSGDAAKSSKSDSLPAIPSQIPKGGGDFSETINIDGQQRHYLLHVPPDYDPAKQMPMVLAVHGLDGSGANFEQETNMSKAANKYGFIVAYPDATRWLGASGWTAWDTDNGLIPPGSSTDDVKFLRTIIDDTQKQANVNPSRIYMAGASNGGMMTFAAIHALSDKIAAVAVISGGMSGKEQSPTEPISILNMHGTDDTVIPYDGVTHVPPVLTELGIPTFQPDSYIAAYWDKIDKITGKPSQSKKGDDIITTATNPQDGATVEQITVMGGKHSPSDQSQVMDNAWQFLAAHPKIHVTAANKPPVIAPIVQGHAATPEEQLLADVKKRGVYGLESDVNRLVNAIPEVQNGLINPHNALGKIGNAIEDKFNDPIISFINSTADVSKEGDQYEIARSRPDDIPLNYKASLLGGALSLDSLDVGTTKFDLNTKNGLFDISKVSGLNLDMSVMGMHLSSRVESLSDSKQPNGGNAYSLRLSQPLPTWARTLLIAPDSITAKIALDKNGKPSVVNESQVLDQTIGQNPFVRGSLSEVQDMISLKNHVSWGTGLNAAKDVGVTAATTFGALTVSKWLGPVGFLAAPVVIDGINHIPNTYDYIKKQI